MQRLQEAMFYVQSGAHIGFGETDDFLGRMDEGQTFFSFGVRSASGSMGGASASPLNAAESFDKSNNAPMPSPLLFPAACTVCDDARFSLRASLKLGRAKAAGGPRGSDALVMGHPKAKGADDERPEQPAEL